MSINLLSNTGTQALASYQAYAPYMSTLNNVMSFNSASIFNTSAGLPGRETTSSSDYSPYHAFQRYGSTGLNLNGPVPYNGATSKSLDIDYSGNGTSIIGNFYTSIQSVALGEYAPTSIAEQRLNYHLPVNQQSKPGATLTPVTKYLGLTSSIYTNDTNFNNAINSSRNVFGTEYAPENKYTGFSYEYMNDAIDSISKNYTYSQYQQNQRNKEFRAALEQYYTQGGKNVSVMA